MNVFILILLFYLLLTFAIDQNKKLQPGIDKPESSVWLSTNRLFILIFIVGLFICFIVFSYLPINYTGDKNIPYLSLNVSVLLLILSYLLLGAATCFYFYSGLLKVPALAELPKAAASKSDNSNTSTLLAGIFLVVLAHFLFGLVWRKNMPALLDYIKVSSLTWAILELCSVLVFFVTVALLRFYWPKQVSKPVSTNPTEGTDDTKKETTAQQPSPTITAGNQQKRKDGDDNGDDDDRDDDENEGHDGADKLNNSKDANHAKTKDKAETDGADNNDQTGGSPLQEFKKFHRRLARVSIIALLLFQLLIIIRI